MAAALHIIKNKENEIFVAIRNYCLKYEHYEDELLTPIVRNDDVSEDIDSSNNLFN